MSHMEAWLDGYRNNKNSINYLWTFIIFDNQWEKTIILKFPSYFAVKV